MDYNSFTTAGTGRGTAKQPQEGAPPHPKETPMDVNVPQNARFTWRAALSLLIIGPSVQMTLAAESCGTSDTELNLEDLEGSPFKMYR